MDIPITRSYDAQGQRVMIVMTVKQRHLLICVGKTVRGVVAVVVVRRYAFEKGERWEVRERRGGWRG